MNCSVLNFRNHETCGFMETCTLCRRVHLLICWPYYICIAELRRSGQVEPHTHLGNKRKPMSWFGHVGCSWARMHDSNGHRDGVGRHGGHTPNNRLTDMQPWFIEYFFSIGHPRYDQLTPVKTRYPLTSIMWPYRGLKLTAHQGQVFFWSWPLTRHWFFNWIVGSCLVNLLKTGQDNLEAG